MNTIIILLTVIGIVLFIILMIKTPEGVEDTRTDNIETFSIESEESRKKRLKKGYAEYLEKNDLQDMQNYLSILIDDVNAVRIEKYRNNRYQVLIHFKNQELPFSVLKNSEEEATAFANKYFSHLIRIN